MMMELEEARREVLARIEFVGSERLPWDAAAGRRAAERIVAAVALPAFDNSAMDGYAVRAKDVEGASPESPVQLPLRGRVAAGEAGSEPLPAGACVRIFTGSPLPPQADAVVMQEDTEAAGDDFVRFLDAAKPWENVRFAGQDVRQGAVVIEPGERIGPAQAGLIGAVGVAQVTVSRAPVVGVLATGNELRAPGEPLRPGQLFESNRAMLAELIREIGGVPTIYPIVPDSAAETEAALTKAFRECDAVVSSGGVSVGDFDFVKGAFERVGGTLDFWRVAIKPGKPFAFGKRGNKPFFGLPGNPVSAFVTFLLLARPALIRMQGGRETQLPVSHGRLAERLSNRGDRLEFVRVRQEPDGQVFLSGLQASHALGSLAGANGLVAIQPKQELSQGSEAPVLRFA